MTDIYRPWGSLSWLLPHFLGESWALLGVLGVEERCLGVRQVLAKQNLLQQEIFFEIADSFDHRWQSDAEVRLGNMKSRYLSAGGDESTLTLLHLLERHETIVRAGRDFVQGLTTPNVIIDISSMPKRYFFPLVKDMFLRATGIRNLIVSYTIPNTYSPDNLAEDPEDWQHLPMFAPPDPEPAERMYVVGLGYEPLGLPRLFEGDGLVDTSVDVLFPFPADPEGYKRNWEFVRLVENELGRPLRNTWRINPNDVPEVYTRLNSITDDAQRYAIFAPYGPKPMSLAICLYAARNPDKSAVYYTQPRAYNPNYSSGIKEVLGFCVRLEGRDLY